MMKFMRAKAFTLPSEVSNYINSKEIFKEDIQNIIFDTTHNQYVLFYWSKE